MSSREMGVKRDTDRDPGTGSEMGPERMGVKRDTDRDPGMGVKWDRREWE